MYNSLTLLPAYGRDYKSKAALLQDWQAGKDFLADGQGALGMVNSSAKMVSLTYTFATTTRLWSTW